MKSEIILAFFMQTGGVSLKIIGDLNHQLTYVKRLQDFKTSICWFRSLDI